MDQKAVDQLKAQIAQLQGEIERMRNALDRLLIDGQSPDSNYRALAIKLARQVLEETK